MDMRRVKELQLLAARNGFVLGYNPSGAAKFVLQGFCGLWEDEIFRSKPRPTCIAFYFLVRPRWSKPNWRLS